LPVGKEHPANFAERVRFSSQAIDDLKKFARISVTCGIAAARAGAAWRLQP
jgi:hypothetical protein